MRLRWSEGARADLLGIFEYVAEDHPVAARQLVSRIREGIEVVKDHPLIGRMVPELGIGSIREKVIAPYRVIYQLRKEEVVVLTVVRSRRDRGALPGEGEE